MKNDISTYYKKKRDLNIGNKPLAAFYQILIIQEEEKGRFSFHKKRTLIQFWQILNEMLDELEIGDGDYRRGICQEVFWAKRNYYLSDEECRTCNVYFEKSRIHEYDNGTYQIHINGIQDMAKDDVDAAQMYADNLLMLLEARYGENSLQYAKMKLHILGEYLCWYKREEFLLTYRDNYDYFRQYTMQCDFHFFDVFSSFVYFLEDRGDKDYGLWMVRFEEDLEQRHGEELYWFFKCKIAWIKAKICEKNKQNEEGFILLKKAIQEYMCMDSDRTRPFYAFVYLLAAYFSMMMMEKEKMIYYAQEGLALCEKINQKGSEVYYNLYNYVGIWHMWEQNWGEAEKLYVNMISEIDRAFGRENENYIICLSNLACTAINRGKDATPYYNEMKSIKSEKLRKKLRILMNNELNYSISRGDSINDIRAVYKRCVLNSTADGDKEEQERLDTLYVSARINLHIFDRETDELLEKLEERYKNNFVGDLAISYWNSRANWEWKKGRTQAAFEIIQNLMQEIKVSEYIKKIYVVMNDIQLLIIQGQYDTAKIRIFPVLDVLSEEVLKVGYGDSGIYLFYIRMLLSMYIHALKRGGTELQLENGESKQLLERVIHCKTIEREIKGLLGKYDDGQMDLYYFKQAHRKLAALEIAYNAGNLEHEDYEKKKMKCLMELGEYESSVSQRIPFRDLIHAYRLEEIEIQQNAACAEYFAYYNFLTKEPMFGAEWEDNGKEINSYLVFVLGEERGQAKILEVRDIPIEETIEGEIWCLIDASKNTEIYDERKIDRIRKRLNQKFAAPVTKYMTGKERLYLGLDFELQMLPVDLIFYDGKGEPIKTILMDSVCYIGEDTEINIEKSDALIIGNPHLNLHGKQEKPILQCGELECINIAEMFGTKAYIGKEASQKLLWGKPKDIIHISTHGVCEVPDNMLKGIIRGNPFIYSYLMFAGYEDWKDGRREKEYGNGMVSGDDFLFMDLSRTKLVVLSACVSGLGHLRSLDTLHGMRWAISAAGADNSITTLWEVSEEATAVLMVLFYRNLLKMPVGEALFQAKKDLRTITVAQLKDDKELQQIVNIAQKCSSNAKWQENSERDRPFSHWKYWAGFVYYYR